ncbi:replication initiation protein, partial [Aliarcobacter butzleri]|uniref:replication initiation protein n=1 Tax=Aliarcobacter butzleri TaxID=28197 RepID=UPI0021B1BA1D
HLTRNQRVGFASLIKNAYLITLEENNKEMRDFEVPLNTILEDMGINHDNIFEDKSTTTVSLEKSLDELTEKKFEWRYKDESGKIVRSGKAVMISDFDIDKNKRTVKFTLSKFVHDRLICYGNAYISEMPIIASFKSGYSVALHEQLEQRKKFNKWKVEVEEFRILMGITENEYTRIDNLKIRVINPAIKEIEKNTEYFNLKYKSIKNGKNISHFEFTWGIDKKEKEHKGQKNFASVDDEIESLKNKVFKINEYTCKLLDIVAGTDSSEFVAKIETSDGKKANVKLKNDIQESIDMMKGFIL